MLNAIKSSLAVAAIVLMGACTDTTPEVASAPKPYAVRGVDIVVATNARIVGRAEDAAFRDQVVRKLDASAEAGAASVAGGPAQVRARVVITRIQVRDAGSRSFGGMNAVEAQVSIVGRGGQVIRGPEVLVYSDQARNNQMTFNGIPIGILANLGQNSADQESGQDIDRLAGGFATEFTNWLKR